MGADADVEVAKVRENATEIADGLEHDSKSKYNKILHAANAKRDAVDKIAHELRAKATHAADASEKKTKEHKNVSNELDAFAKAEKIRSTMATVPGIFNDCSSADTCALGCVCKW